MVITNGIGENEREVITNGYEDITRSYNERE